MQVQVTGRHVDVTADVREHIDAKIAKLPRFYDRIHEIDVILDHEMDQFTVEIIVRCGRKQTFVVQESGPDTFALIDVVVEKVGRQLTKHKEKHRNRKRDGKGEVESIDAE